MASSYIPSTDAAFGPWLLNLATLTEAAPADYGLSPAQAAICAAQNNLWIPAYTAATDPSTRTPATVAAKDAVRAAAEEAVRPICVQVSLNPAVLPANKIALGVTLRKTTPTPVPPPTTRPGLSITALTPGVVGLSYKDVDLPAGKAKPPGVIGMEVWGAVGTEFATDPNQARYLGTMTKSPNRLTFADSEAGKKLSLWARWVTRSGAGGVSSVGPWSDRLTTIIA